MDDVRNLRTLECLERTLDYLIESIVDVDVENAEGEINPNNYVLPKNKDKHEFWEIYKFVNDRMRQICQDFSIQ